MSDEFYRQSPGKLDSRTLNRKTLNRWTGRTGDCSAPDSRLRELAAQIGATEKGGLVNLRFVI